MLPTIDNASSLDPLFAKASHYYRSAQTSARSQSIIRGLQILTSTKALTIFRSIARLS